MDWFGTNIQCMRSSYNCTIGDPSYTFKNNIMDFVFSGYHVVKRFVGLEMKGQEYVINTERAIEIPLALNFLSKLGGEPVMELGCVLPYYIHKPVNHIVYDLADVHPDSIKRDIRDLSDEQLSTNVISISTLEHINTSEYGIENRGNGTGYDLIERIVKVAKNYFISVPLGYTKPLDELLLQADNLNAVYVTRDESDHCFWKVIPKSELTQKAKSYGTVCCANTICVLTNIR